MSSKRFPLLFATVLLTLAAGGCRMDAILKEATVSTCELDLIEERYLGVRVFDCYDLKCGSEKEGYRNEVVLARMRYVDALYEGLVKVFHVGRATENFLVDAATISLNAVGALAGVAETKALLHVLSGGLIGLNASFNKEFFEEQGTFAVVQKMDALRAVKKREIYLKLRLNAHAYTFHEALGDVDDYLRAGSIVRGLAELSQDASHEAHKAAELLRLLNEARSGDRQMYVDRVLKWLQDNPPGGSAHSALNAFRIEKLKDLHPTAELWAIDASLDQLKQAVFHINTTAGSRIQVP